MTTEQTSPPLGPVAVLGANGFVGRCVVDALTEAGIPVRAVVRPGARRPWRSTPDVHELDARGWAAALAGCDAVVHLIARTHHLRETEGAETDAEYRRVNVDLTADVLSAATAAGVRRLVYMSSVKAMGESRDVPYREGDEPKPLDAYGRTKLEAEQLVLGSDLRSVVLRPPLVYGPGVGGNVARLLRAVERGVPLPLGRATARRSLISTVNLADAVRHVVQPDHGAHGLYLVADTEVLSVRELVEGLAAGCGRPARLVPVPVSALRIVGRLTGRSADVDRLVRPLVLDTSRIRSHLGWRAPVAVTDGLRETARAAVHG